MKQWTDADETILCEKWGQLKGGIPALARKLNRSIDAVKVRAQRLKLGPWQNGADFVSLCTLIAVVTGQKPGIGYSFTVKHWESLGLPIHKRRTVRRLWRMVRIDDFWKWAQSNQDQLNFTRFEENTLGKEPTWVKDKRRVDLHNQRAAPRYNYWLPQEDALLRSMLERNATWEELESVGFQHSGAAIRRRIYDLYLPHPKSKRGCGQESPWSHDEALLLQDLKKLGFGVDAIAQHLGRTSQSVRGKLEAKRKELNQDGS